MTTRYRVDCTNCGWTGYRRPHPDLDCACYSDYAYYCTPTSPGPGCSNGANLRAPCAHCRNLRIEIHRNAPTAHHDKGRILIREVPIRATTRRNTMTHTPNPDVEREIAYVGGPWDGKTRWEPKCFWPPQNQRVSSTGKGFTGVWPERIPADEARYMPQITPADNGCQVRMIWARPDDEHAPLVIPQPNDCIKDYSDHD